MNRYRRDRWEGMDAMVLIFAYPTVLSEQVAGALVRRRLRLPLPSSEALMLRHAWAEYPSALALAAELHQQLELWSACHPQLQLKPLPL